MNFFFEGKKLRPGKAKDVVDFSIALNVSIEQALSAIKPIKKRLETLNCFKNAATNAGTKIDFLTFLGLDTYRTRTEQLRASTTKLAQRSEMLLSKAIQ